MFLVAKNDAIVPVAEVAALAARQPGAQHREIEGGHLDGIKWIRRTTVGRWRTS
jgi:hypothetical protein